MPRPTARQPAPAEPTAPHGAGCVLPPQGDWDGTGDKRCRGPHPSSRATPVAGRCPAGSARGGGRLHQSRTAWMSIDQSSIGWSMAKGKRWLSIRGKPSTCRWIPAQAGNGGDTAAAAPGSGRTAVPQRRVGRGIGARRGRRATRSPAAPPAGTGAIALPCMMQIVDKYLVRCRFGPVAVLTSVSGIRVQRSGSTATGRLGTMGGAVHAVFDAAIHGL